MAVPISMRRWFAWPSRFALLLGIGAVSAAGAEAAPSPRGQQPQSSADRFGGLHVWSDGGRVYLVEAGAEARELQLGDTAEARRLKALLQRDGGTNGVRLDRIILAGGGGCGFDFAPPGQTAAPTTRTSVPAPSAVLRQSGDGTQPVRPTSSAASRHTAKDRSANKD